MIRFLLIFCIFAIGIIPQAIAEDKLSIEPWSSLPILHEGRIKPIDSFARIMLKKFSGSEKIGDVFADQWLAESLFMPERMISVPVFKIREPENYGLIEKNKNLYSYEDLSKIISEKNQIIIQLIKQNPENWSDDQKNLMSLHEKFILYSQILRSLTLFIPFEEDEKGFLNYKIVNQELEKKVRNIVSKKGTNLETYTDEEKSLSFYSYQISEFKNSAQNNVLLRIIPDHWTSPWATIKNDKNDKKSENYLILWHDMFHAYKTNNIEKWQTTITKAQEYFQTPKYKIEKIYNGIKPFNIAFIFYVISFLLVVITNLYKNNNIDKKLEKLSFLFLSLGFIIHTTALTFRIYILERPPVGTLYESILFVSLICILGFLIYALRKNREIGVLLGSLSAMLLLTTANGFSAEDNMGTLVAVLNTNFWLTTHVLCITIGYGVCLIASLLAHYDLFKRWAMPNHQEFFTKSHQNLKMITILALLFVTIGTILGGIWADQSWGRFWGWDPKENGALLIVLWLAWILHGLVGNQVTKTGFSIGIATLSIIVVLAWFGVNLLNVGLHSYGFISGVAWSIGLFCTFEILFIGTLWYLQKQVKYEN